MQQSPLVPFVPFEFTAKTAIHLSDHRHRISLSCLQCITRITCSLTPLELKSLIYLFGTIPNVNILKDPFHVMN
jgi:hypothetical protein